MARWDAKLKGGAAMDLEGRACSARSERALCDAAGTWLPVLRQSFLYANKPVLAPKVSAAPPMPAMPAPSIQDARAVWARRGLGAAWRLVVLWRAHPCEMAQKVKCLSNCSSRPIVVMSGHPTRLGHLTRLSIRRCIHPIAPLARQSISEGCFCKVSSGIQVTSRPKTACRTGSGFLTVDLLRAYCRHDTRQSHWHLESLTTKLRLMSSPSRHQVTGGSRAGHGRCSGSTVKESGSAAARSCQCSAPQQSRH